MKNLIYVLLALMLFGGMMSHTIFYSLGGIAMIVIGFGHLLSPEFGRKLLVGRSIVSGEWKMSPTAERIGVAVIRFVIGPVLIVLGCALLFRFIP
jgi:hypothetical protein